MNDDAKSHDPTCDAPRNRHSLGRALWSMLWQQPLYALGFGLFFGLIYGSSLPAYRIAFECSLVFAYVIRLSLVVLAQFGLPWLRRRWGGELPVRIEAPAYVLTAVLASYLAAALIDRFLIHGFLGSPAAVLRSGAFALVFAVMFVGIAYAMAFGRQSVERARALEHASAELASAELRALRAQIQPHFLFNTLNTIAALIRESPAEAEETVTQLADLFRHALRASEREHRPLVDELDMIRAQLAIERTRFGTRLRVEERIEPGLEQASVPSLILQPLVENAVRHAVTPSAEGATIGIAARREGDRLQIEVWDDGPGIATQPAAAGNGFGLRSVRERLRAAGPHHALEIVTAPGAGTRIRITLPYSIETHPTPEARHA